MSAADRPSMHRAPTTAGHPALAAVSAALEDAAATLHTDVGSLEVFSVDPREWPDSCLGLPRGGEGCAEVVTPGYRVQVSHGLVYRADLRGHVRRDASATPPADGEVILTYTVEDHAAGHRTSYRTDSYRLREAEDAELRRLVAAADFFAVDSGVDGSVPAGGRRTRLHVTLGRRNNREVVRGDGIESEDTSAFRALVAWVEENLPRMSASSAPLDTRSATDA